ncbi:MAG: hypothetical protein FVQ80_07155 [Planctomycetes bacterium]|nr:hypothetical protein [Planctomycetota bacterium]
MEKCNLVIELKVEVYGPGCEEVFEYFLLNKFDREDVIKALKKIAVNPIEICSIKGTAKVVV